MSALRHRVHSHRLRRVLLLAALLVVITPAVAAASSDVFQNVGPAGGPGGLAARYPLGNYALDHHFTAIRAGVLSGVDVSGVPALIAYFLADVLWQLTAFLANALITLFGFAFSLDLVNGSQATGGAGALAPISQAVHAIYSDVFGEPWLGVAVVLAGLWAMWKALVQRRYTETAGALALSLVFVVIALAFVLQPGRTIGQATRWSNQMSGAFLSLADRGQLTGQGQARRGASDQLFALLVYEPWAVLNFGGREHCARNGTGSTDKDPQSVPVRPLASDPARAAALSRQLEAGSEVQADGKQCVNNARKYAPHFLAFAPDSDARNAEYDALNSGDTSKLPDQDPAKQAGDYRLGIADKPATDAMEKGGQYQRLLLALVVFLAELGAFLLLGSLSVSVVLAQVMVLLLLAFGPVALVAGVYPGRGHDLFRGWLSRLASFLLRKAIYSLILAVLLAVLAAVSDATAQLGWLLSFGLQAAFLWAVFLHRHQLTGQLAAATTGAPIRGERPLGRLATVYYARQLMRGQLRRLRRRPGPTGAPHAPADAAEPRAEDAHDRNAPTDQSAGEPPNEPSHAPRTTETPTPAEAPPAPSRPTETRPESTPAPSEPARHDAAPGNKSSGAANAPLLDELRRDRERLQRRDTQERTTEPEGPDRRGPERDQRGDPQ